MLDHKTHKMTLCPLFLGMGSLQRFDSDSQLSLISASTRIRDYPFTALLIHMHSDWPLAYTVLTNNDENKNTHQDILDSAINHAEFPI